MLLGRWAYRFPVSLLQTKQSFCFLVQTPRKTVLPLMPQTAPVPRPEHASLPLIPLHTSLPGFCLLEMLLLTISFHQTPDILPDLLSFPGYFPQASIPAYLVSHPFNPFIWLLFYYSGGQIIPKPMMATISLWDCVAQNFLLLNPQWEGS